MRVRPPRSSVSTRPGSGPTRPDEMTSTMRSPSTTTAAPSIGSLPVQSIRNALVNTVIPAIAGSSSSVLIACAATQPVVEKGPAARRRPKAAGEA